jgi:rhamnosyltransferase subunit B
MANVALVTFGSSGDVHPMLAIAQDLRRRGHRVALLTNPFFVTDAVASGVEFIPVGARDDYEQTIDHPKLWHPIDGLGVMWRYLLRPALAPTVDALAALHRQGPWLVIASPLAMGARLAQEKYGVRVVSSYTSATMLRTVECPMTLAQWQVAPRVPRFCTRIAWAALDRFKLEPLVRPALDALRAKLALPPLRQSVFGQWMHSPIAGVTLFPEWFAPAASDWPAQVVSGGFPLFDGDMTAGIPPALKVFVEDGPAPVVFMQGTAAVDERGFFKAAARACDEAGVRGVFLGRVDASFAHGDSASFHVEPYAPFGWLLPRARALVHHGGIGSCAQALRAGIPQLIAPRAYDQFDNAMRLERLGVGFSLGGGAAPLERMGTRLLELLGNGAVGRACLAYAAQTSPRACQETLAACVERFA